MRDAGPFRPGRHGTKPLFGPLARFAGHAGAYVLVALALALLGQVVVLRIVGR
ncbi:MAG: hypothetical protein ACYC0T_15930 [Ramlibacter sp.]